MRNGNIERLNTNSWTLETLGEVPAFLENPGKCAYLEANGTPGKDFVYK